jgi:hypothetical protein
MTHQQLLRSNPGAGQNLAYTFAYSQKNFVGHQLSGSPKKQANSL